MEDWKITSEELIRLRESCLQCIRDGELYELRNDAKLRAVYSTKSYEEFNGCSPSSSSFPER
ncbi:uncharacterized protein [Drosophila takahashii]|uniref:uncharacterized protein isoform X2 n=1 Tax=Drosophila takahashii TaxID=29030 RepID=UPI0007E73AF7